MRNATPVCDTHATGALRDGLEGETCRSAAGTGLGMGPGGMAGSGGSCASSGDADNRWALHHRSLALVVWLITKADAKRLQDRHAERVGQPGYPRLEDPWLCVLQLPAVCLCVM